jgi:hypothetical protein
MPTKAPAGTPDPNRILISRPFISEAVSAGNVYEYAIPAGPPGGMEKLYEATEVTEEKLSLEFARVSWKVQLVGEELGLYSSAENVIVLPKSPARLADSILCPTQHDVFPEAPDICR